MIFSIKNPFKQKPEILKISTIARARRILLLYPFKATELAIDDFLKKEYGINLRMACLQIFNNCQIMENDEGELRILIPNKHWDLIASIITYGPDGLCGSKILRNAFSG